MVAYCCPAAPSEVESIENVDLSKFDDADDEEVRESDDDDGDKDKEDEKRYPALLCSLYLVAPSVCSSLSPVSLLPLSFVIFSLPLPPPLILVYPSPSFHNAYPSHVPLTL